MSNANDYPSCSKDNFPHSCACGLKPDHLSLCMYVCVCVCMYVCMHVCTYACRYSYKQGPKEQGVAASRVKPRKKTKLTWLYEHSTIFDSEEEYIEFFKNVRSVPRKSYEGSDTVYVNSSLMQGSAWRQVTMRLDRGVFSYYFDGAKVGFHHHHHYHYHYHHHPFPIR